MSNYYEEYTYRYLGRKKSALKFGIRRAVKLTALIIFIAVALLIIIFKMTNTAQASGEKNKQVISIQISAGDTLWSIASEYADDEMYDDNNEFIEEVKSINGLSGDTLIAGAYLIIPYFE